MYLLLQLEQSTSFRKLGICLSLLVESRLLLLTWITKVSEVDTHTWRDTHGLACAHKRTQ